MTQTNTQAEMSFFDHLEELRWHVIRSIIAVFIITIVVFLAKGFIFDYLIFGPRSESFLSYQAVCSLSHKLGLGNQLCLVPTGFEIINYEMAGQFLTHIKVSLVLGFILSFPYCLWEVWRFIKPGLYEKEVQNTRGFVFFTSLLFFTGVLFGYFVLSPLSINFFASYSVSPELQNKIQLTSYISIITTVVMASGVMFELPMAVFIFSKLGLLTPDTMRTHRKHALVVILITAAIITPADVWTQLLVSIPVYFLYELSIFISAWVQRKAEAAEKALSTSP